MIDISRRSALIVSTVVLLSACVQGAQDCVPAGRLENMTKGEKVGWCGAGEGGTVFDWDENNIRASAVWLKSYGFRHVRINMEMGYVWNTDCSLNMTFLPTIRKYVNIYLAEGLCVMLDPIHGATQNGWSNKPAYNDLEKLKCLWNTFADYFKDTDPEKVFFELYNEPCCDAVAWSDTQKELVTYVRAIVPNHTLILTSSLKSNTSTFNGAWDHIGAMIYDTEIVPDRNVVYSIHFYDPFEYTHQCLQSHGCGTVNYPDASKGWNKAFLNSLLVRLYDWSVTNNVAVHCGEFGDDYGATGAEVVAYANDMLDVLNSYGIPWTNWMCEVYDRAATDPLPAFAVGTCGGTVNQRPLCSITTPSNGASYTAPADIVIGANATDRDGSVVRVEFYRGTLLLGSDDAAPYSYTWLNVPAGAYNLTVKAFDNQGASTTSSAIALTVRPHDGGLVTVIEDNAPGWNYTAGFDNAANADASGGTVRSGWQAGATMSRSFTGTMVEVYGITRPRAVSFDIRIDGVTVAHDVSTNGPLTNRTLLWASAQITNATHTIEIVSNGDWVDIDFIIVTDAEPHVTVKTPVLSGRRAAIAAKGAEWYDLKGAVVRIPPSRGRGGLPIGTYYQRSGVGTLSRHFVRQQ